uniref:Uncharacterized protein n=1 Tax=Picea glauca TaxID=3330 RepID=A0A101M0T8_PICGL|nr:hypothetical protein ABT39_MTgene4285 [Picea glauca]QHR91869.1 hypothetical protein Q903MT_gene5905 [Picea sitchensis]
MVLLVPYFTYTRLFRLLLLFYPVSIYQRIFYGGTHHFVKASQCKLPIQILIFWVEPWNLSMLANRCPSFSWIYL